MDYLDYYNYGTRVMSVVHVKNIHFDYLNYYRLRPRVIAKMGDIEQKLDPEIFMRSHKSYIINLTKIKTIEPYGRWTYIVTFKDIARDALLTQEKYEEIRMRFG